MMEHSLFVVVSDQSTFEAHLNLWNKARGLLDGSGNPTPRKGRLPLNGNAGFAETRNFVSPLIPTSGDLDRRAYPAIPTISQQWLDQSGGLDFLSKRGLWDAGFKDSIEPDPRPSKEGRTLSEIHQGETSILFMYREFPTALSALGWYLEITATRSELGLSSLPLTQVQFQSMLIPNSNPLSTKVAVKAPLYSVPVESLNEVSAFTQSVANQKGYEVEL